MSKKNKKDKKKNADGSNKHDKVNGQSSLENPQGASSIPPELSASERLEEKMSKKNKKDKKKDKKKNSADGSEKQDTVEVQPYRGTSRRSHPFHPRGNFPSTKKPTRRSWPACKRS